MASHNIKNSVRPVMLSPQGEALDLVPEQMARKYHVIPLEIIDNKILRVGMVNPSDIVALEVLASHTQKNIEPERLSRQEIDEAIDFNYKSYEEIQRQVSSISIAGRPPGELAQAQTEAPTDISSAPVVQALSLIINEAVKARASDIHLQPQESRLRVRFRIDGRLHDMLSLPVDTAQSISSRIKVMANMNIADRHRPQDGQFSIDANGRVLDVRVATTPTVHGEMVALRLLDKSRAMLDLAELGLLPHSLKHMSEMLKAPHGMLLVCGPTGAGKTTTLYAAINSLDCGGLNIITVEDPVEYRFKDINQIQVNTKSDVTFAAGLRSILRLDPDVVLIGEIRDTETAKIAIQAALTGHLVLSSIHANDAVTAVTRLADLGVEPFLVSTALLGVVAQRMVRQICPYCNNVNEIPLSDRIIYKRETGDDRTIFNFGKGCDSCANTGYFGRTGIFEILRMDDELRNMVLSGATNMDIRNCAIKHGMISMLRDGMLKVQEGITTPAEVLRNAFSLE